MVASVSVRLAAIAVAGIVPVAAASATPAKAKKPPAEISIENGRKVALNSFEITFDEPEPKKGTKPRPPRPAVVKLDEPLAPGEKKVVKLIGARGCAYVAKWAFVDAKDEGRIDLCGDPKIVLTD